MILSSLSQAFSSSIKPPRTDCSASRECGGIFNERVEVSSDAMANGLNSEKRRMKVSPAYFRLANLSVHSVVDYLWITSISIFLTMKIRFDASGFEPLLISV